LSSATIPLLRFTGQEVTKLANYTLPRGRLYNLNFEEIKKRVYCKRGEMSSIVAELTYNRDGT